METSESQRSISPESFKATMRRFANNVNVITSSHEGVLGGMTATAVCSATAEPPCLLIVVNKTNRSHRLIDASGAFSVNLLSDGQKDIANNFASGRDDIYSNVRYSTGINGCPHIEGADTVIDCYVVQRMALSSHTVFLGEVAASVTHGRTPLLYHAGTFGEFRSDQAVGVEGNSKGPPSAAE